MEYKLNKADIENYAKAFAAKIINSLPVGKTFFSGKELLQCTPILQVNYFVLRILFEKWNEDMQKISTSPYFDYQHEEVMKVSKIFQNTISNHIKVSLAHLEPLLIQATQETIYYILSPYQYFKKYIFVPEKNKISIKELENLKRYIKFNSDFYNYFLEKITAIKIESFLTADILTLFQQIYFSKTNMLELPDKIIAQFQGVLSIAHITQPENFIKSVKIIEDKFVDSQSKPISSSSKHIEIKLTLNQRIMFSKTLFNNNDELLNQTLAQIESCATLESAMGVLNAFNWGDDNEVANEFFALIEAKFKLQS